MTEAKFDPKTKESINLAITQEWEKALELNLTLAKKYPKDIDTLNRLARTYMELGKISSAKESYQKVLKIDQYNPIASKNIKKLSTLNNKDLKTDKVFENVDPDIFLEEPGKTKVINLENVASKEVLAKLRIGDKVTLKPQKVGVIVFSSDDRRIGEFDKNWSSILSESIKAGSKFESFIKSVTVEEKTNDHTLSIFVKEVEHSPKIAENIFPASIHQVTPFVREEALSYTSIKTDEPGGDELSDESSGDEEIKEEINTDSLETLAERETKDNLSEED